MVSAKLYAIYWLHKDNLYHTKKELKYNHIHFERTGGSGEDVELQVWVEVKGKGLKTFMKDLKNKTKPNLEGREHWLKVLSEYPWS